MPMLLWTAKVAISIFDITEQEVPRWSLVDMPDEVHTHGYLQYAIDLYNKPYCFRFLSGLELGKNVSPYSLV